MANELSAAGLGASRDRSQTPAPVSAHRVAESGLTPAQERFALLIAQGCAPRQAYVLSHGPGSPASVAARVAELAGNERIRGRIRALLRAAKIDDLDSLAQYHGDLMRQIAVAMGNNNLTAVAALMRLRGQTIGALQERTIVTDARALSDAALVAHLAKGDTHKAAVLTGILADGDSFES